VLQTSPLQTLLEGQISLDVRASGLRPEIIQGLAPWSRGARADGEHLSLTLESEAQIPVINRYLVEQGVEVFALRPQRISLEDLFIEIVGTDGGL
jgi:ABC-2 type transport system ATP-binding protein